MLAKISEFVKGHYSDILLALIIILIGMLMFACGFIAARYLEKQPLQIDGAYTATHSIIS